MKVIVITGPTASGKSALAVEVAERLGCEIISADSRQIYRRMPITTAVPTAEERRRVRHHLVEFLEPTDYYSAAQFEADALRLIADMERRGLKHVVVCGGAMMYIDALLRGLDDLPGISDEVRAGCLQLFENQGIEGVIEALRGEDPQSLLTVDLQPPRRLIHALEITRQCGRPASSLRRGEAKPRPFEAVKFAIDWPREELFNRINRRVEQMVAEGMEAEAEALLPLRGCNALNTVGFKEIYAMIDGLMDRPTALARIAKNTRVYAKKQLTWLKRDNGVHWLNPADALRQILSEID